MRVFYLYPAPRSRPFGIEELSLPSNIFYGLKHLQQWGIEAFYKDEVHRSDALSRLCTPLKRGFRRLTGQNFQLDIALKALPFLKQSDLILVTSHTCGLPVALLKALKLFKAPLLVIGTGATEALMEGKKPPLYGLLCWLYKHVDRVISVAGERECENIAYLFKIPRQKVRFLPYGIDVGYYYPVDEEENYILSVGVDRYRNYEMLFQIAEKLGVPFKVVTLPFLVKHLSPPPHMELIFDSPMYHTRSLLQRALMVILTMRDCIYFSGHTTIFAGMACGKPVIFTETPYAYQYRLKNMENCVITSQEDAEEIISRCHLLLSDSGLRRDLGKRARAFIVKNWPAEIFAKELLSLFNEVLNVK